MNVDFLFIVGVLGAAVAYSIIKLYSLYAAREFHRLRSLDRWSSDFTEMAMSVLDHSGTPVQVVDMLYFLNERIGDPKEVALLCRALRSHHGASKPPIKEIAACERELRELIADTIFAGVLALTYSDWYWGVRARAILAGVIAEAARNPKPIMDVIRTMPAPRSSKVPRHFAVLPKAA